MLANRYEIDEPRHWIGVRLRPKGRSPLGALITVRASAGAHVARIVSGDSLYMQHAPAALFGLGNDDKVASIQIRWADGKVTRLDRPAVDKYHDIKQAK